VPCMEDPPPSMTGLRSATDPKNPW
jgi:hypothetical protein